jgi:hypothetical protein
MTSIVVLTVICVMGIAFLLRFLVALFQETKTPSCRVVHVLPNGVENTAGLFIGRTLDYDTAFGAEPRSHELAAGQD